MRARRNLVTWPAAIFVAGAVVAGCSSSSGGTPFTLTVSQMVGGQAVPLPGASVALDEGNGARFERTTGADGTATFQFVDPSLGPFAFTAASPGFIAVSDLGLTKTGTWNVTLAPLGDDPSWADVSGAIDGKVDDNDELFVSANVPSTTYEGYGPEYAIRVAPSQQPFTIVVAELAAGPAPASPPEVGVAFQQWAAFQAPAPNGVVALSLTLPGGTAGPGTGESLAPMQVQGTFSVPAGMTGADGSVRVTTEASDDSAFFGAQTSVVAGSAGVLQYTAEYVVPAGEDLETRYALGANGASSYVLQDGPPAQGPTIQFLPPPSLPPLLTLYGNLPITNADPSLLLSAFVQTDGEQTVWRVYDEGAAHDSMRLPELPSGIDPRDVLGTGDITVSPEVCELDASTQRCSRWAVGAPAELLAP
jgi:hypothetical protein